MTEAEAVLMQFPPLEKAAFVHPWHAHELSAMQENRCNRFYVYTAKNATIAYAIMQVIAGEAECLRFAVLPEARNRGYGSRALRQLLADLQREGVRECFLEVRADHKAALRLYTNSGFMVIGHRKDYYDDGCDAVLMKWEGPYDGEVE